MGVDRRRWYKRVFSGEVSYSSLILMVTSNLFNAFNFLFNVAMAYLLSLESYGSLAILMSSITVFGIFGESIQIVISRYVSNESNNAKIHHLLRRSIRKTLKLAMLVYLLFLLAFFWISHLLEVNYGLFVLAGLLVFLGFNNAIMRGALQGKRKFFSLGLNLAAEGGIKFLIAVLLVLAGLEVQGAILGVLLGGVGALFLSQISLRNIFSTPSRSFSLSNIYSYARPVFVTMISIVLFLSVDVILAGIFFEPAITGSYAIASILAKIIFIGTQPISKAMFPFTSDMGRASSSLHTFIKSLIHLGMIIFFALIFIFIFSDKIIFWYSGRFVFEASQILPYLAVAMSLLSITNLVLLYGLSIGRTSYYWMLLMFVIFQAILLSSFNSSLLEFSIAGILASITFLGGSILAVMLKHGTFNHHSRL